MIADEYVDKDFGSGCVKITPAHDFNDFEVGKRHNLEMLSVLDKTAHMNENCPAKYRGMDRYECRKAAVEDLKALGLLVNIKAHKHMVPRVSRTGEIVEPMLSEQWYMAMSKPAGEGTRYPGKSIAEVGLEAVESGEVNIFPKEWQGVYRQWLENPAMFMSHAMKRKLSSRLAKASNLRKTKMYSIRGSRRLWFPSPRSAGPIRRAMKRQRLTFTCPLPCW